MISDHVIFRINEMEYALSINGILEVCESDTIRLPGEDKKYIFHPKRIVDKAIIPVDVRSSLGSITANEEHSMALIIDHEDLIIGLVVDDIVEVVKVDEDEFVNSSMLPDHCSGMTELSGRVVLIFDGKRYLSDHDLSFS
jgi:chemotaxis signal transduction protein